MQTLFDIIKSRTAGKVPVKRRVTRRGATFMQTYWVTPAEAAEATTKNKEVGHTVAELVKRGKWKRARKALQKDLEKRYGWSTPKQYTNNTVRTDGKYPDGTPIPDSLGIHAWDGKITLQEKVSEGCERFVNQVVDRSSTSLLHEELQHRAMLLKARHEAQQDRKHKELRNKVFNRDPNESEEDRKKNVRALFDYRRRLGITAITEELANLVLDQPESTKFYDSAGHFKTFVHEVVHNNGPFIMKGYRGAGAVVEEVSTEVLARKVMTEYYGLDPVLVKELGTYQDYIDSVVEVIKEEYKTDDETAYNILEEASSKYKSSTAEIEDPSRVTTLFAKGFPPTGVEYKDRPSFALTERDPETGELVNFTEREWNLTVGLHTAAHALGRA